MKLALPPGDIEPARRRHVVFFPPTTAPRASERRRLHLRIMRQRTRRARWPWLEPVLLPLLLAVAPPVGLLLLWTRSTRFRSARAELTCVSIVNVLAQAALVTLLSG